jgi:hypothetical protein
MNGADVHFGHADKIRVPLATAIGHALLEFGSGLLSEGQRGNISWLESDTAGLCRCQKVCDVLGNDLGFPRAGARDQ